DTSVNRPPPDTYSIPRRQRSQPGQTTSIDGSKRWRARHAPPHRPGTLRYNSGMRPILPVILGVIALTIPAAAQGPVATPITVYKTPTCGCCAKWVDHMRANGFAPKVEDLPNLTAVKTSAGIPPQLQSCHTSMVQGYAIRSEEHTSELQSRENLVCRLLLEKK